MMYFILSSTQIVVTGNSLNSVASRSIFSTESSKVYQKNFMYRMKTTNTPAATIGPY